MIGVAVNVTLVPAHICVVVDIMSIVRTHFAIYVSTIIYVTEGCIRGIYCLCKIALGLKEIGGADKSLRSNLKKIFLAGIHHYDQHQSA